MTMDDAYIGDAGPRAWALLVDERGRPARVVPGANDLLDLRQVAFTGFKTALITNLDCRGGGRVWHTTAGAGSHLEVIRLTARPDARERVPWQANIFYRTAPAGDTDLGQLVVPGRAAALGYDAALTVQVAFATGRHDRVNLLEADVIALHDLRGHAGQISVDAQRVYSEQAEWLNAQPNCAVLARQAASAPIRPVDAPAPGASPVALSSFVAIPFMLTARSLPLAFQIKRLPTTTVVVRLAFVRNPARFQSRVQSFFELMRDANAPADRLEATHWAMLEEVIERFAVVALDRESTTQVVL